MEEFVGELWHKLITRQAQTDFAQARVEFASLQPQLATYFRAMGGEPGKNLEGVGPRAFNPKRRLVQRMAGSHRHFPVCWQDERGLRLPLSLACFSDNALNEALYFWQTALAAQLPRIRHWFVDNQQATRALLEKRPGLAAGYQQLVAATLKTRPDVETLKGPELEREQAILEPGSVEQLPLAAGDPLPVPIWIYPAPLYALSPDSDDDLDDMGDGSRAEKQLKSGRKQAERFDDAKQTDGLLVFKLECLFTWAEQVDLDRCQEENLDDDPASTADDLDIISLSRKRRAGAARLKFDLDLPSAQNDDLPLGDGIRLPEWDYRKQAFIKDYCLLQPMLADDAMPAAIPDYLRNQARVLKNRFSLLRPQRTWQRRQPYGDEIDLDAWLELKTQPLRNEQHQDLYRARNNPQRDMACLLLADLSMSTDAGLSSKDNSGQRVIDVIRDSMLLFAEALSGTGDPFAIYGFSSVKNKQVRYQLLKNFSEPYGDQARGRLLAVKPGFYTRMGAAIRQSTEILKLQKAQQRLLLILSDGKPNDIDRYEGRYGIEDTRRAVLEAKQQGLQPFCVTIDETGNDYLPYLFGEQGYAVVNDLARLPVLLPKLYLNLTGISA